MIAMKHFHVGSIGRWGRWALGSINTAALALVFVASTSGAVGAGEASSWVGMPETKVRLLTATHGVGQSKTITFGLEITLAPGWKTYWRSPGDAGMPPQLDWGGSTNLADARILWPAPKRFTVFDLETFGYGEDVILPIEVQLEQPGQAVSAQLNVFYQVCKDICIPVSADLSLEVPAGPKASTSNSVRIANFQDKVPTTSSTGTIAIDGARLIRDGDRQFLEVLARAETPFQHPDIIVEAPTPVSFGAPDVRLDRGGRRAVLRLPIAEGTMIEKLAGIELIVTLIDGAQACETTVVANFDS